MTTQFAPVCPLNIAKQLAAADPEAFGNYHLLIATEVLKDPIEHNRFWTSRNDDLVILDNGVIEAGKALNVDLLAAAAVLVHADIVVVPDVIADPVETLRLAFETVPKLRGLLPRGVELMGVIQATDVSEARAVAVRLEEARCDWLAIPKGYRERAVGSRTEFSSNHILGFSNVDWPDDVLAARGAGGIDSAVPIWAAIERFPFKPTVEETLTDFPALLRERRPKDYMDMDPNRAGPGKVLADYEVDRAIHNIRMVRRWLNDPE